MEIIDLKNYFYDKNSQLLSSFWFLAGFSYFPKSFNYTMLFKFKIFEWLEMILKWIIKNIKPFGTLEWEF